MEERKRKQFTFYESFFKALSRIRSKAARCDAYDALCSYALTGIEPNLDSLTEAAAIAFELIKPTLDASAKKAANGNHDGGGESEEKKSGGEKRKNKKSKSTENHRKSPKITETEKDGNEGEKEVEVEKEVEIEGEVEIERKDDSQNVPPNPRASDAGDREAVRQEIADDLTAARERWGHWERSPSGSEQNTADRAAEREHVDELIRAAREKAREREERFGKTNGEDGT